jgi:hypothetical protein
VRVDEHLDADPVGPPVDHVERAARLLTDLQRDAARQHLPLAGDAAAETVASAVS